jgi:hypothetical protein
MYFSLSETLTIVDVLSGYWKEVISDLLDIVDVVTPDLKTYITLQEDLNIIDALVELFNRVTILTESLSIEDSIQVLQYLYLNILESLSLNNIIVINDEEYLALVVNTETNSLFKYTNYPFNSFSGRYAAYTDGIYELDNGNTDNGTDINAFFETGFIDFGSPQLKRMQSAYIGFLNDGTTMLRVATSDDGVSEASWYELDITHTAYDTNRITMHNGIRSRYWKFTLSNVDNSDIDLDTLQLIPVVLLRRIH